MTAVSASAGSEPSDPQHTIAFQGLPGAYSHLACLTAFPELKALPCPTFEETFAAVTEDRARLGMIPVENSVAGRVADIHHLLPENELHIVAEHFQRVNHHLLAPQGATIQGIRSVHSHVHALNQCRNLLRSLGVRRVIEADTAGAAADIARGGDPTRAAIASDLAGEIYGLISLQANIEDADHNTTRFLVMAREPVAPNPARGPVITSFVFTVKNRPAALYKALGGFATNGVNIWKIESYLVGGNFVAAQFYVDVEGHPEQRPLALALEELRFFSHEVRIIGIYPAHPYRFQARLNAGQ